MLPFLIPWDYGVCFMEALNVEEAEVIQNPADCI